jgi:hypothetical protein
MSDIDFFKAHPDRSYRVRHATPAEVDEHRQRQGTFLDLAPGRRWLCAVHQAKPGFRVSVLLSATECPEGECPEHIAADVFKSVVAEITGKAVLH